MKKLICLILIITMFITIAGCASENVTDIPDAANFYYATKEIEYHTQDGLISYEERGVKNAVSDLTALINLYLEGPLEDDLMSPFPNNTIVRNISHNSGIFSITLSNEFSKLTGYDLSVACACLTLTIQEFVQTNLVQISAENAELDGNKYISMNTDSLVIYDQVNSTDS